MTNATAKVMISAAGKEYSIPVNPKNLGNNNVSPTPKTTSLISEITVDSRAVPSDCRQMNVPLLTVDNGNRHRYILKALIAKSV